MNLGKVVGRVWCTIKDAHIDGHRLLVVQPITPDLRNTGKRIICGDSTGAGAGEIVYWVRGREASIALAPSEPPFDATIVGIVDTIHFKSPAAAPETPPRPNSRKRKGEAC
jgi:microcompartment protein CcmK/EutM